MATIPAYKGADYDALARQIRAILAKRRQSIPASPAVSPALLRAAGMRADRRKG